MFPYLRLLRGRRDRGLERCQSRQDTGILQASTGALASQKANYLWDTNQPLAQLALERDGNNTLLRRYVYGVNRISMTSGGNAYYYQYDPLGSVVNLTNATGATEWTDSYEPYGAIHSETKNDPSAPTNLMKFAAEYNDPTGLYYLRRRQYDPNLGRFAQVDPVSPRAGQPAIGSYVYVADRPSVMVDPSGMTSSPARASLAAATLASSTDDGFLGILDDWWRAPARLSAMGFNFLLQHEGNRGLYDDSQGNCTFGIGHLVHLGPCTPADHSKYDGYTLRQRYSLAHQDIARFEGAVHSQIHVPVTQYQFDALVSFTFNIGIQAFSTCTALRKLNAGAYRDVPAAMMLFSFPPEIRGRRCDEARLFATGRYTDRGCS